VALATEFRRFRPRLVLGLGAKTPTASPDHYQASLIVEAAVFYSKLTKWDEHFGGTAPYEVPRWLKFFLAFDAMSLADRHVLVVDISDTLETKLAAIGCYASQFSNKMHAFERFRAFAMQQGMSAGFAAGEVLASPTVWGTGDLMGLLFPS
jgi:N-acetylglucosamine malate deacetylase 1